MTTRAIISYDDTLGDLDALAFGRVLADAGVELMLAYVRHVTQSEPAREELAEHDARALLERGARWLGDLDVAATVVLSASTGEGLWWLAEREHADIVVFGSDYRTAPGHVEPQRSAQRLLEGGPAAVAIAPAGYRTQRAHAIGRIGVLAGAGDPAALETARALADRCEAELTTAQTGVDLLVVGSRPEAADGQVLVTAQAQNAIENASSPVLVVPRGVVLGFEQPARVA